jgi:hypothetical protein
VQTFRLPSFYYYALIPDAKFFQSCRREKEQKDKRNLIFSLCFHCVIAQGATTPIKGYLFLILRWNKNGDLRKTKDAYGESVP